MADSRIENLRQVISEKRKYLQTLRSDIENPAYMQRTIEQCEKDIAFHRAEAAKHEKRRECLSQRIATGRAEYIDGCEELERLQAELVAAESAPTEKKIASMADQLKALAAQFSAEQLAEILGGVK